MCSDSEKNMSAFADQNHAPSLTCVRLELHITATKLTKIAHQALRVSGLNVTVMFTHLFTLIL